ncbi:hypothetical protein [Nannocystis pusilla]
MRAGALIEHAVIYYGPNHDEFASVWAPRGGEVVPRGRAGDTR